jgi:hypothetical protein
MQQHKCLAACERPVKDDGYGNGAADVLLFCFHLTADVHFAY